MRFVADVIRVKSGRSRPKYEIGVARSAGVNDPHDPGAHANCDGHTDTQPCVLVCMQGGTFNYYAAARTDEQTVPVTRENRRGVPIDARAEFRTLLRFRASGTMCRSCIFIRAAEPRYSAICRSISLHSAARSSSGSRKTRGDSFRAISGCPM